MDKREKEIKKMENGNDVWLNSKSQNDRKTVNEDSTIDNPSSSKLKQSRKTSIHNKSFIGNTEVLKSSISNHTSKKESILSQPNNIKLDNDKMKGNIEPDNYVVVIDSDSEINVEKPEEISKPLLRKPSLDSSQLNPISKRLKSSDSSLPSVYYIEADSKLIFSSNNIQVNGTSSLIQSNKGLNMSPFLSKSTFSYSPTLHNNNSLGSTGQTTNGTQYSQINYQYPNNTTNGLRPFHNGPEELNAALRSPTPSNGNKTVNVSQGSGVHLPSIQGLLEISSFASIQPQSPNPLPVVVVDPNPTIVQPSSFSAPLLPSFQNSNYYTYSQQQAMSRTTPPNTSPIQHHSHIINNNTSTGSTSTNSRHYIPIAPSPISTTTGGRNRPPPPTLQTSTSTSIYTSNTTNHLTFPATESDHQWQS